MMAYGRVLTAIRPVRANRCSAGRSHPPSESTVGHCSVLGCTACAFRAWTSACVISVAPSRRPRRCRWRLAIKAPALERGEAGPEPAGVARQQATRTHVSTSSTSRRPQQRHQFVGRPGHIGAAAHGFEAVDGRAACALCRTGPVQDHLAGGIHRKLHQRPRQQLQLIGYPLGNRDLGGAPTGAADLANLSTTPTTVGR